MQDKKRRLAPAFSLRSCFGQRSGCGYGTVTVWLVLLLAPSLSVTVSVTV
jgi:hypothetical protein